MPQSLTHIILKQSFFFPSLFSLSPPRLAEGISGTLTQARINLTHHHTFSLDGRSTLSVGYLVFSKVVCSPLRQGTKLERELVNKAGALGHIVTKTIDRPMSRIISIALQAYRMTSFHLVHMLYGQTVMNALRALDKKQKKKGWYALPFSLAIERTTFPRVVVDGCTIVVPQNPACSCTCYPSV